MQGCCLRQIYTPHPTGRSLKPRRSPTCKVLGAAAKNLGAQSIFLGTPGYQAPVRQQHWIMAQNSQPNAIKQHSKVNPKQARNYFRHSIENCSLIPHKKRPFWAYNIYSLFIILQTHSANVGTILWSDLSTLILSAFNSALLIHTAFFMCELMSGKAP